MAAETTSVPSSFTSSLREDRIFPPPAEFASQASIRSREQYDALYRRSIEDSDAFWAEQAQLLDWFQPFHTVLEWNVPHAKWFTGGTLNLCYNAVDRHAKGARASKTALIWEGEPGEVRSLTYEELHIEVQRFANVLKNLGVKKGDRVAIYMGVSPEIVLAVLACARLGAVHNVVFGGFAAHALADRMADSECRVLITQDAGFRRGQEVPLKSIADEAVERTPGVEHVLVYRRCGREVPMKEGRDHWLHEELAKVSSECPAEPMDSEDPLFILYTSGTTGKPKGLVHTTAGYGLGTMLTSKYIFDLQEQDVYWCTADVGWITGHSYVVYGPLLNGATALLYEGAPNWPEVDRFWDIVDRHKVSIFYTAPTAIRAFMKWGAEHVRKHSLSTLRLLGTVGEPINPEAWMWYHREIGHERCPIVDTWWQTETGSIMIAPIPGAVATKPGSATLPFFGVLPEIVTKEGEPVPPGHGGLLVIRKPWPAMARTIYGNPDRYQAAYWSEIPGSYFTGDGARRDEDGYFWLMGRVDDVLNVSGHRLGTMEIESALVAHTKVTEAAIVGRPDDLKGEGIVAFVSVVDGTEVDKSLADELKKFVAKEIGALARPDEIRFTQALPKTRSGKIMRRLLRELAATGDVKGDTTTLEDFSVVAKLKEKDEE
ncbi:acetate--CoA ligase [Terriglobus roseus]|uniref:Acetyl-coenzyme A synthetase n=1 Tax=Terriglobus roseus TaxID=392734 RepID=A0A1G7LF54_9BACT|nr:acetate--CoA ligase [Terriglobus roseus]SDF48006.1 acetyl-coenzyme A synthetase [Terriglobus roseus]